MFACFKIKFVFAIFEWLMFWNDFRKNWKYLDLLRCTSPTFCLCYIVYISIHILFPLNQGRQCKQCFYWYLCFVMVNNFNPNFLQCFNYMRWNSFITNVYIMFLVLLFRLTGFLRAHDSGIISDDRNLTCRTDITPFFDSEIWSLICPDKGWNQLLFQLHRLLLWLTLKTRKIN